MSRFSQAGFQGDHKPKKSGRGSTFLSSITTVSEGRFVPVNSVRLSTLFLHIVLLSGRFRGFHFHIQKPQKNGKSNSNTASPCQNIARVIKIIEELFLRDCGKLSQSTA